MALTRHRLSQPLVTGVLTTGLGLFAAQRGYTYSIGTLGEMGPGFFPFWMGMILTVLGVLSIVSHAMQRMPAGVGSISLRAPLLVSVGIGVFAFLIDRMGIVPAIAGLVLFAGLAEPGRTVKSTVVLIVVLAVFAVLLFSYGLGLPVSIAEWPF